MVDMNNFKIISSAHYLPKNEVDNHYFANYLDTSDEWISKRTGIKSRRINEGEINDMLDELISTSDLSKHNLDDLTTIIVASSSNQKIMPNLSAYVHKLIGAKPEVTCLDINTACSGFVTSIITASKFLSTHLQQKVLVIGIDQMSSIIDFNDRNTCILFGDGAGLMLLEVASSQHLIDSYSTCDYDEISLATNNQKIVMQGQEVFKYAVKEVCNHISHLLEVNNLEANEIDYIICHQANERILKAIRRQFLYTEEQVLSTISWTANTSSASIPICFDYYQEQFKSGDKIIMVGFGAGLITNSVLYQI